MSKKIASSSGHIDKTLTERELEILLLLKDGLKDKEIAQQLHLATQTVRWYNSRIYSKLHVNNRVEVVDRAKELGLIETAWNHKDLIHNLPSQLTNFVGRQQELITLEKLLKDDNIRLLTLLASGGMGKTRLAIEVASTQLFEDGVFFVSLAPLTVSENLVTTISKDIGFFLHGDHPPKQQLMEHLSDKTMLLILDNFEHLLDGTSLVSDILYAAPKIMILVTSRERLNIRGETIYQLSGLRYLVGTHQDDLLKYDATKLFVQSARRSLVDFNVETDKLEPLIRICQLTEGMPLALELAAGWVDVLTLDQIATELQQGIDILNTELRDVPDRHRSIRATFEGTWRNLSEKEQKIFARLSVFRGRFTLEAVQKIAGANIQQIRRLVQKAFITKQQMEQFTIHELLRQYGNEKLSAMGEINIIQQAHCNYYMEFLSSNDAKVKGQKHLESLEAIRTAFENIRTAWIWAVDSRKYEAISYSTLDCLTNFAEMNFSFVDIIELLEHTIDTLDSLTGKFINMLRDSIIIRREYLRWLLGQEIDDVTIRIVLLRMRDRDAKHEIAFCLHILTLHAERTRDNTAHEAYSIECLALWRLLGDTFYVSRALGMRGHSYKKNNDIRNFLGCWEENVSIQRQLGIVTQLCASLCVLGWFKTFYGEFAEAENLQNEALAIQSQIGRKVPYYVFIVGEKARLAFWRGEFSIAREHIQAGLDFADGRDYLGVQPYYLSMLSWIASIEGDYEYGYELCKPALDSLLPNNTMYILWALALVECGLERYQAAYQTLKRALDAARNYTRGSTHQLLCLPIAVVLEAHRGQTYQATKLMGLTQTAPKQLMGWLEEWQLFRDVSEQLRCDMGMEIYSDLLVSGSSLELDLVVDQLLTDFDMNQTRLYSK